MVLSETECGKVVIAGGVAIAAETRCATWKEGGVARLHAATSLNFT